MPSPATPRRPVEETHFGVTVEDPYRWLENADDPEVLAWTSHHDERARDYLEALPARDPITQRLKELIYVERRSAPTKRGQRYFFSIKPKDQEKDLYYYRDGKQGTPVKLLDENLLSPDGNVSIGAVVPSFDGKWLLYFEHSMNADAATLRVLEVDTGRISALDVIEGLRYTLPSWARDDSGFYYLWLPQDPRIPPNELVGYGQIHFHRLGQPPAEDVVVHPATNDPSQFLHADVSHDGSRLLVTVSEGWAKNRVFVKNLKDDGPFVPLGDEVEALTSVNTYRDRLFIRSNAGAPRFRVWTTTWDRLERAAWQELVPQDASAVLEDAAIVGGQLVLRYLKDAFSELQVRDIQGQRLYTVPLPTMGTSTSLYGSEDDPEASFEFSSFTHPPEIHELDLGTGARHRTFRADIPVRSEDFVVRQEWFSSRDGTRVPMFVVHRTDWDGSPRHTLLTGYGGFNLPMLPQFHSTVFPWLESGGHFAMANLRGGGEFGQEWHEAGKGLHKQNAFDDFIAAAEHLIAHRYTEPPKLGISGRSNGGLLVGAAMTQRPDLFGAVLCGVPLLDMLRYQEKGLGTAWIPEYGDVNDESSFRALFAYSPYHRVRDETRYPPLLMLSADADDRVDPMHARKFVARLSTTRDARVYLRVERRAGHGGSDVRSRVIARSADELAFLLDALRQGSD